MSKSTESPLIEMVREFHAKARYEHEKIPNVDDPQRRDLWARLLVEEHGELLSALQAGDVYGVADGIADCLYVLIGAALAFAIPLDEVFREVHSSNLSKIGDEVVWREDGKILRGQNYQRPDIRSLIDRYRRSEP